MTTLSELQPNSEHPKKTTSRSETGHAKNVSNFDELISYINAYGATYNPTKTTLKPTALQTLSEKAKQAMNNVNAALPAYSNAVAARDNAFAPLSKLMTRVINAIKATETTTQVNDTAETLTRKIQGKRATAKATEAEKATVKAQGKETKEISSSQMSYDNRLDNLDKLIKLLASIPLYAPNENELKVTTLTTLYNDLKTLNTAVLNAIAPLNTARMARNNVMCKKDTGLVDTALNAKTYIKSLYGATSPEYKQIAKLEFRNRKI